MQRRAFLASAGGTVAALAGCLGTRPPQSGGSTPTTASASTPRTPSSTQTAEPTLTADVAVDSLHLQYGVVTQASPDSIGVSNADTPYLVASVSVDGSLSWERFGLREGDVLSSPTRIDRLYRTSWGDDHWYEAGRPDGLVLFEAPSTSTKHLRLMWPGGERPVGAGIVERINASAPQLSVSLDAPSTHDSATAPPVSVEVTNGSEVERRFLGALNRIGPRIAYTPVARLSELVPAGETVTLSVSDSWSGLPSVDRLGDDTPDVTYRLHSSSGEQSAEIRLVDSS